MSGEVHFTGNLTSDPELRYTQTGIPVAGFTIAINDRKFNRQTNEWEDGEALFLRVSVWREQAEHVAASVFKGNRVTVSGKLRQRSYDDKDGQTRTVIEMEADEVAASLKYATAALTRASGGQGGTATGQRHQATDAWAPAGAAQDETPW